MVTTRSAALFSVLACGLVPVGTLAASPASGNSMNGSPVADALTSVDDDVRVYNDHLVTLANPYMQGRVPGSEGMERAKDYVQFHFEQYGLEPAFKSDSGEASYRDPFELGGSWAVEDEGLSLFSSSGAIVFEPETDFVFTGLGGNGEVLGEAVFVGYSIDDGPDGYSSYADDTDLTGKVAVMLRFEPMDDEGKSRWTEDGRWSNRAGFAGKIRSAIERNAAAIVIINPPGSSDPRANALNRFSSGGGGASVPVIMASSEAGDRLLKAAAGKSLQEMRNSADEAGGVKRLGVAISLEGKAERKPLMAENVGGVLRGAGDLADEWIVVGGHLDHLGMGYFGSRSGPGTLHPGADDNASGSAGIILLAQKLAERYASRNDERRRSILFVCFSGEESGLNGSRHYVSDPIVPIEDHKIMVNWDMIGRIQNERLTVAGVSTGEGLDEFLQPFFDDSGLEIIVPRQMSGASDHTPFFTSGMPVLFSIIADFHDDYHTPDDVSWKINRVGAVKTVRMYTEIVDAIATRNENFTLARPERGGMASAPRGGSMPNVRVGVMPGSYDENGDGIPIAGVTPGGAAEEGGMLAGDRIVRWNGQKVTGVQHWMTLLAEHEPGDEVKVGVKRDGEEVTLTLKLQSR